MMRPPALLAVASLVLLAGCTESVLRSERVLGSVELDSSIVTTTEGLPVSIPVRVLDQHGAAFDRLPPWIQPVWESSDEARVAVVANRLQARAPGQATVTVRVAERTSSATVRVNPDALTVRIHGFQLSQAIQRPDGTVPLIEGRDGYLRVFVTADRTNFFPAGLRVRFFRNGALQRTWKLSAPADSIPRETTEAVLASTWNVRIPGELIRTGTSILVDVDPEQALPTTPESRLTYPVNGDPLPLDVRAAPHFAIRLVPIQGRNGVRGAVSEANMQQYIAPLVAMFPLGTVSVDVRDTYHTIYMAEGSDWVNLLVEILALRIADSSDHYYYGVTRRVFGPIGIGFLGYPVAVGFDQMPEAPFTLAHELGHNFGLFHAPCGGPDAVDPRYPYARGAIGVFGLDLAADTLVGPETPDVMGYCRPRWLSDYHYESVVAFREAQTNRPEPSPPELSLLVWGRVSDGQIHLEPAFEVFASPRLPRAPGPFTLEGRTEAGARLFSFPFSPLQIDHAAVGEGAFAFTVPLPPEGSAALRSLHVRGRGLEASRVARPRAPGPLLQRPALPSGLAIERGTTSSLLRWDAATHPMVLVRDARSGSIIGFGRDGSFDLPRNDAGYELVFSDGVRSSRSRVASP
jgi:hypothetical protein